MSTAGICPCGGHLRMQAHTVKSMTVAKQWVDRANHFDLPLRIERKVCNACGRDEVMKIQKNFDNKSQWTLRL